MEILGIGIDLVEIRRMESILASQETRFVERVFTPLERDYCEGKRHRAQYYAARFAAKEALMKALGTGWTSSVTWTEIEVQRDSLGKPGFQLYGATKETAEAKGAKQIFLSLSHTDCCAVAQVILCR
jgi:holo-[acyl-carrier protein] synthase